MLMMMWLTTFVEMTNFCAMREKGMMDFRTDNHEIRTSVCSDIRFDMEGHFQSLARPQKDAFSVKTLVSGA